MAKNLCEFKYGCLGRGRVEDYGHEEEMKREKTIDLIQLVAKRTVP